MIRKLSYLLIGAVLIGVGLLPPVKVSAFDANNIMSDSMFENGGTMSAGDIDTFLNKYATSCISTNNSFQTPDPQGFNGSAYTYGGNVSGGTAIAHAAAIYHLNPQVLVATLQKEQSIPTGGAGCHYDKPNPADSSQIYTCTIRGVSTDCTDACPFSYGGGCMNIALGYDCPGSCKASNEGFHKQLILGAWILRFNQQRALGHVSGYAGYDAGDDGFNYSGAMVQGTRQRNKNEAAVYWDGSFTPLDSGSVTINNGATASLYDFTPFVSGNSKFVNIFENTFGFGSTTTGLFSIAHPFGTLVRPANSPAVYLITTYNGNPSAQRISSLGVFQSWGYDFSHLKIATAGDLNLMAASDADTSHTNNPAPLQLREGTIVKSASAPTIYAVKNAGAVATKRAFDSWPTFTRLGYSLSDVITIPDSELPVTDGTAVTAADTTHSDGALIRDPASPTVYLLINGERHALPSAAIFASHGHKWSMVKPATAADNQLNISWPIYWLAEGTLVRGTSGPTVYIIQNFNVKRVFSYYAFLGFDYRFSEVMQVTDAEVPPGSPGTPVGQ